MRLVIIGGDAAGMSAASRAKRMKPEMEVMVFEQGHDVSYSACAMPYRIADREGDMESLVVRPADVFIKKEGIDLRPGHRVLSIDRKNRSLSVEREGGETFTCQYDRLIIATGASPVLPDIPGIRSGGVLPLKTLEEGRRIKSFLAGRNVKRAVIMGTGFIAMEMAEALRELDISVTLVEIRDSLFPWMHGSLREALARELESHGVNILLGCRVESIESSEAGLTVVCNDKRLECDMVIPAVGVRPNSGLAAGCGLELGPAGSIATDAFMRTSDPDIYSAGDCADAFSVITGKRVWVPLALRANRAGRAAAENICGEPAELEGIAGTAVFKAFGLQVARTGLSVQEARDAGFDPLEVMIESNARAHSYPGGGTLLVAMTGDRKSGRLLGVQMTGQEGAAHRINSAAVALHAGMTVDRFLQCDMAYAPPFSPVWDPLLVAARELMKKM
jgi:NADPH-dependent 2,4-dienoyl-CoA reductase/sulfur reductase-like enzyme